MIIPLREKSLLVYFWTKRLEFTSLFKTNLVVVICLWEINAVEAAVFPLSYMVSSRLVRVAAMRRL